MLKRRLKILHVTAKTRSSQINKDKWNKYFFKKGQGDNRISAPVTPEIDTCILKAQILSQMWQSCIQYHSLTLWYLNVHHKCSTSAVVIFWVLKCSYSKWNSHAFGLGSVSGVLTAQKSAVNAYTCSWRSLHTLTFVLLAFLIMWTQDPFLGSWIWRPCEILVYCRSLVHNCGIKEYYEWYCCVLEVGVNSLWLCCVFVYVMILTLC